MADKRMLLKIHDEKKCREICCYITHNVRTLYLGLYGAFGDKKGEIFISIERCTNVWIPFVLGLDFQPYFTCEKKEIHCHCKNVYHFILTVSVFEFSIGFLQIRHEAYAKTAAREFLLLLELLTGCLYLVT